MNTEVLQFFKKYYKSDIKEEELKNIVKLNLRGKYIDTLPYSIFDRFINLHTLYLSNNNLTTIHCDTFVNNVNLHTLYLSHNKLTVIDPNTFVNNVNLHNLHLSYNNLTAIDPNTFVNNVNLHILDLYNNNLTTVYCDTFVNNINLHTLNLYHNKLTAIDPNTFVNNINLHTLVLSNNKLTTIDPNTFANNVNLHILDLSYNNLTTVYCDTFVNNVNLHTLNLCYNKLTAIDPNTFVNNVNLHTLYLSDNKLTAIDPNTFVNNMNLHTLNLCYNNLSSLPLEIINLRNLINFYYDNNPIENIHPILVRFLDTMRNIAIATVTNRGIYTDGQSVHSSVIQESVRNSIISLLKDENKDKATSIEVATDIINDDVLTADTKALIFDYIQDKTTHSTLYITFEDLLIKVWNRIKWHSEGIELKQILNQEMKESECKCFTGRISRLVNVLAGGYFDDIKITIQTGDQIGNIILAIKERLEKEGCYTLEKHREDAVRELTEREYEQDIIKVWVDELI